MDFGEHNIPPRVSTRGANNREFLLLLPRRFPSVPSKKEKFKKISEELQGDIFEGKSRSME